MSARGTGEGSIVQLAGMKSCQRAGQYKRATDEWFGVLDGEPERPPFIGVKYDAELGARVQVKPTCRFGSTFRLAKMSAGDGERPLRLRARKLQDWPP